MVQPVGPEPHQFLAEIKQKPKLKVVNMQNLAFIYWQKLIETAFT